MSSMMDVAKAAGVSLATVSRVLNNKNGAIPISTETRRKVMAVIRELNYRPNYAAQRLRMKTPDQSIGLYIPWGWGFGGLASFTGKLLESVSRCIEGHHYTITLIFYDPGSLSSHFLELNEVHAHRIGGMIIAGASHADLQFLETVPPQGGPPFVVIHRELTNGNYVTMENSEGARTVVEHLIAHGHSRIALISSPPAGDGHPDYVYAARYEGYRQALQQNGLPLVDRLIRFVSRTDYPDVEEAVGRLLDLEQKPTAVFAARDTVAVGVLRALRQRGVRVPDDIAVAGFSENPEIGEYTSPALTSAAVNVEEMGEAATRRIIEIISSDKPPEEPLRKRISCSLLIRESCGDHPG